MSYLRVSKVSKCSSSCLTNMLKCTVSSYCQGTRSCRQREATLLSKNRYLSNAWSDLMMKLLHWKRRLTRNRTRLWRICSRMILKTSSEKVKANLQRKATWMLGSKKRLQGSRKSSSSSWLRRVIHFRPGKANSRVQKSLIAASMYCPTSCTLRLCIANSTKIYSGFASKTK